MRTRLAALLLALCAPAVADRPPCALEGWAFTRALLDGSAQACGATVTGAHVAGGGLLSGPALRTPEQALPRPRGAGTFEVRHLFVGRADSGRLQVNLMLALHADDPVSATLMLEDLLARLAAQPELRAPVARPTTWPLPEERGLVTSRFSFLIDLTGRARPRAPEAAPFLSIEHAARSLAARPSSRVPGLRYGPGGWSEDGPQERRTIDLRPAGEEDLVAAAHLHRFLLDLEDGVPGLCSETLLLETLTPEAQGQVADAWRWASRLEQRRPRQGQQTRPWPSALEGLHLVLDLLAAFERQGVALDGFVPGTTYGPRTPRELGLNEQQARTFATRAGYAIELRSFGVASQANGEIGVELDLRFDHPAGAIESTRLFELFRQALVAQPEVAHVERVATETPSQGTGVVVDDLDLTLRSLWPARADRPPRRSGGLTYLQATAARDGVGVGQLEIGVRESPGMVTYLVSPERPVPTVQGLYDFLWSVETDEAGYTLVRVAASPPPRAGVNPPRGWHFDARVWAEPER